MVSGNAMNVGLYTHPSNEVLNFELKMILQTVSSQAHCFARR